MKQALMLLEITHFDGIVDVDWKGIKSSRVADTFVARSVQFVFSTAYRIRIPK